jgi:putative ATP-dependent endonuclease of the OLD family
MILIDETEHGLEPHRIIRFLTSLGAKDEKPPLQVFMTTHSPVVLRELSGGQLFVVRRQDDDHDVRIVGTDDAIQGTIRLYPDAFLAPSVLVCEGATEVGFVRGVDLHRIEEGETSLTALGVALVDCGGGEAERCFERAVVFQELGYRTAILRDGDKDVAKEIEKEYTDAGGTLVAWRKGRAIEDELFVSLSDDALDELIDRAIELHGEELIDDHIKSASGGKTDLARIRKDAPKDGYSDATRALLGKAARSKKAGWFKSVSWMEDVGREIAGPDLPDADAKFKALVEQIFKWAADG